LEENSQQSGRPSRTNEIKPREDRRAARPKLRAKESKIEKLKKEHGDLFVLLNGGGSKSRSRSGNEPELTD
jgi:hypothetical protein